MIFVFLRQLKQLLFIHTRKERNYNRNTRNNITKPVDLKLQGGGEGEGHVSRSPLKFLKDTHICITLKILLLIKHTFKAVAISQAPVVQRLDNYFIQWISHYPTVSISAKISSFPRLQANMHTH